ncbi:MAG TPA: TQO small subunit DoxD [Mycobacteriales bacterium]|nr:TQO small subunit DoxD [Mycobacteriales bacterium]
MTPADGPGRPSMWGPQWEHLRFNQLGWRLLPLRGFLGVTFVYASLQKLANPAYLRASSPTSFVAQTKALEATSPIAPLLRMSLHAPTLVALLIAFGELAVALGIVAGLFTRVAAVGGMLLSLTFFLTVSWSTTPYFYGSDIVFVFAWSVFAMCGAGGVLSLDAWISARAEAIPRRSSRPTDLARRQVLVGARSAAFLAVVGGILGGMTALIGRAAGSTKRGSGQRLALDPTTPSASPSATSTSHPHHHHAATQPQQTASQPSGSVASAPGTALAPASAIPIGQGRQFTDPATGEPAWLLRPSASKVAAFSAVCTHAGCAVSFDAANNEFLCPCHGGRYSASTGAVVAGPPPSPLRQIPARIVNHEIRVD